MIQNKIDIGGSIFKLAAIWWYLSKVNQSNIEILTNAQSLWFEFDNDQRNTVFRDLGCYVTKIKICILATIG